MTYSLAMLGVSNVARVYYGLLLLLLGSQGSGRWTIPVQTIFISPVINKNHKTTNTNFEMLVERDLMSNFFKFFFFFFLEKYFISNDSPMRNDLICDPSRRKSSKQMTRNTYLHLFMAISHHP